MEVALVCHAHQGMNGGGSHVLVAQQSLRLLHTQVESPGAEGGVHAVGEVPLEQGVRGAELCGNLFDGEVVAHELLLAYPSVDGSDEALLGVGVDSLSRRVCQAGSIARRNGVGSRLRSHHLDDVAGADAIVDDADDEVNIINRIDAREDIVPHVAQV